MNKPHNEVTTRHNEVTTRHNEVTTRHNDLCHSFDTDVMRCTFYQSTD